MVLNSQYSFDSLFLNGQIFQLVTASTVASIVFPGLASGFASASCISIAIVRRAVAIHAILLKKNTLHFFDFD